MDVSTAVERVRARLAKQLNLATTSSTSASSSADESPEPPLDAGGGGFELVTLQEWIRKEGGGAGGGDVVKCGGCEAPFLRGDEASICIACGSQRLTKLNNSYNNNASTKLDYKLSIAFSRFLETIHRSIEVGGSMNHQISMDSSSADQASATTTSKPPLQVASSIPSNPVPELSRKSLSALGRNTMVSPRSRQNSSGQNSSLDERMKFSSSSTMDVMANDFDDSLGTQEEDKATDTIFQKTEMLALSQGGGDQGTHQDVRFLENLEGSNQASGSTADFSFKAGAEAADDWGFVMSSEVQPAGLVEDDYSRPNNLQKGVETEDLSATTHNPEYDLSFFDTLGVGSLKKEVSAREIEAGRNFWDDHTEVQNLKTEESRRAMDRFASDASAFTTLSDSGSDSGYNSSEIPGKRHMEPLVEVGGNDMVAIDTLPIDTFNKILISPESQLGNLQTGPMPWASDPFSIAGDIVDLFPLPLESSNPTTNAPNTVAVNEASQPQLAVLAMDDSEEWGDDDDFIWSQAEPAQQAIPRPNDEVSLHELSGAPTSVTKIQSSANESWQGEDFLFDESQIGILISSTTRGSTSPNDTATKSFPIIGEQLLLEDDNVFKNHLESVSVTKSETDSSLVDQNGELLNEFPSVTYQGEQQASHEESRLPEVFLVSPAQPEEGHRKPPGSLSQSLSISNEVGLGSLPFSTGDALFEDDDIFKSLHVRSASYGKAETKASPVDQNADSFKRSVSFGNLQLPTTQGDAVEDLLSSLKLNSAPSNRFAIKSITADQGDGTDASKRSLPRSISFGEINLEPDHQDHSPSFTEQVPSQLGTSMQVSIGSSPSKDPFSFIQASTVQSATTQPIVSSVQDVINSNDDDDDDFEWKSADIPYVNASLVETQVAASPQTSRANGNLFQWAHLSPLSFSDPITSTSNPSTNGSRSHVFPLQGGALVESPALSQIQTISSSRDAVPLSSKVILNGGWSVTAESSVSVDSFPLPQSMGLHSEHVYDSDDEFSDFVSPPPPPPPPSWRSLHPTTKAPLDMSWFEEQSQPSSKEGRDSGLFGDLMGIGFANT
ncbi:hypothetical protein CY35_16G040600 [Sphagnum magellanicum]|nr:hypothetical protein CY35_16G040600 [Sphagnum magellanicum]